MKTSIALFLSITLFASQQLLAHGDHNHVSLTDAEAITLGSSVAKELSARDTGLGLGQLPASWASIPKKDIAMYKKGNGYYIVSVKNGSEKKTVFILMSSGGEIYDANFSGTFKGVE